MNVDKEMIGELDIEALSNLLNADLINKLRELKGIGVWTIEMLMIFCLQRPDVMSYSDLGIHRGLHMPYHQRIRLSLDK